MLDMSSRCGSVALAVFRLVIRRSGKFSSRGSEGTTYVQINLEGLVLWLLDDILSNGRRRVTRIEAERLSRGRKVLADSRIRLVDSASCEVLRTTAARFTDV